MEEDARSQRSQQSWRWCASSGSNGAPERQASLGSNGAPERRAVAALEATVARVSEQFSMLCGRAT
eukprot:9397450-Lingulodinium_polyedra.AAC.1